MTAIILSIGDELILGQTVDTNSAWLSRQLAAVGCVVKAHITVPDEQQAIEAAIRNAAGQCDVLLITGGLGPTADDLTRQAIASVLNAPLIMNEEWLAEMQRFFTARNRPMPPTNAIQAMIPRGSQMLWNSRGTAAGIHAQLPTGKETAVTDVFVMPGVPGEMKGMFERDVLPHIAARSSGAVILSRSLHTFGLGESTIGEMLGNLMDRSRNPSVGTTVAQGIVSLRINARFPSNAQAEEELNKTTEECYRALGDLIFGEQETSLPQVVATMLLTRGEVNPEAISRLTRGLSTSVIPLPMSLFTTNATRITRPQTIVTAESCTGGLLAKMMTDISGSSEYFKQGWITYSNQAKTHLLGVPPELIAEHGAASEPTVLAMARGARERADATFALAISGVAGPTGGTPQKPVGTVCIGLACNDSDSHPPTVQARTFHFPGERDFVRDRAAKTALDMLRYHLLGKPLPY